ncbi:MAG: ornithine carbamoyltransferase [Pseudomonadales bacterium]|nr:ornithine carbamoyltransferase [Pseudomonadales bacterium]
MRKRNFLTLRDMSPEELKAIIQRAGELKRLQLAGQRHRPLEGMTGALILELSSTRTRVAFEAGMHQLGGHVIVLDPSTSQLGRGEPIRDTAEVLSGIVDIVMIRCLAHKSVEEFAQHATVPVINAMTRRHHPCQLLADVMTFEEHRGSIAGRNVAFLGDGYNMCNSYIEAAALWNFNLRVSCPPGYEPESALVQASPTTRVVESPEEAVADADLVVTDVWSSMGHDKETDARRKAFSGWQVNEALLDRAARDVLFMHCLPAHRGEEISDTLLDDPRSVAYPEAHNRLHTQKALMEMLLT